MNVAAAATEHTDTTLLLQNPTVAGRHSTVGGARSQLAVAHRSGVARAE
jgi:hypothetical protein